MNIPNSITLLRIVLIPVFVILYYLQPVYSINLLFNWANIALITIYAIIGTTDFLDGYLARKMGLSSKLGAFLDPVADKLMVSVALVLLVDFYPAQTYWYISLAALIIIFREILISALREWMSTIGKEGSISVSYTGKVKTFVQIFAIVFLLYRQPFLSDFIFMVGVVLLFIATCLTVLSGTMYIKESIKHLTIDKKTL